MFISLFITSNLAYHIIGLLTTLFDLSFMTCELMTSE